MQATGFEQNTAEVMCSSQCITLVKHDVFFFPIFGAINTVTWLRWYLSVSIIILVFFFSFVNNMSGQKL